MPLEYVTGGVRKWYDSRPNPTTNPEPNPAAERTAGESRELILDFSFDRIPSPSTVSAADALELIIPANSFIVSARLYNPVAWVGGTSLAVDSRVPATGAVATANGFVTAAQGATANLTLGSWITGTGGLVGAAAGVGVNPVKVGVTAVGTFTAGRSKLVITYILPTS